MIARDASETSACGVKEVDLSIIVTVVERPVSLVELYREFSAPLREAGYSFEFIFAAHPWFQELISPLEELAADGAPIRVIEVGQAVGETTLLKLAAEVCRGRIVVTLPAYHQVEAGAVPALAAEIENGADLAVAQRHPRSDSPINRIQSRVLHAIITGLARERFHDVACGVRAIRPEVLTDMPLHGDFARFLPLIARRDGYAVVEVPSAVHPDAMSGRVYRPGVYVRRLIDVLGLIFLLRFTDKPLRFFGLFGGLMSAIGAVMLAVIFVQRVGGQALANRPLLLLGVLLAVLGMQAIALGLVGEMIVHLNAPRGRFYRIRSPRVKPAQPPDS